MKPCATPRCRNVVRSKCRHTICYRCDKRRWRANNPEMAAYSRLKAKAKARGIEFTITFDQFMEFARGCDYVENTGNFAWSITVDRIDNLKGYVEGNIQPLSRSENVVKQMKYDQRRYECGFAWRR